jgi:pyruvate dehydrogenase E1 component alpha subunit
MKYILNLYHYTYLTRAVDLTIKKEYHNQLIRCPVHLSIGQEGVASGVSLALNKKDMVMSNHRSHSHYLAKGGSIEKFVYELYGKKGGSSNGKGGSMHLIDLNKNFYGSTPIVGSTIPIATGLAFSNKIKNHNDKIVVVYFGDGAFETGNFHECLNFASLRNLRILFVCENNFYSVYSSLKVRQNKKLKIFKTANNYNINSLRMDGHKPDLIYQKIQSLRSKIIKNSRPYLIEFLTYRDIEHCGVNNDDDLNYRSKKEINIWRTKCPILYLRKKYKKYNKNFDLIENLIQKKINKIFKKAMKKPYPDKNMLSKNIYA